MYAAGGLELGGALADDGWHFGGEAPPPRPNVAHVLWRAMYRDVGRPESLMEQPEGESFLVDSAYGNGAAHTPHRLLAPLPGGDITSHTADLAIGWEGGAWLYIDVIHEGDGLDLLKARAYDAIHLRTRPGCHPVLVWVRGGDVIDRDTVEGLAHPYAFLFGMHADDAAHEGGFAALRAHITAWLAKSRPAQ